MGIWGKEHNVTATAVKQTWLSDRNDRNDHHQQASVETQGKSGGTEQVWNRRRSHHLCGCYCIPVDAELLFAIARQLATSM